MPMQLLGHGRLLVHRHISRQRGFSQLCYSVCILSSQPPDSVLTHHNPSMSLLNSHVPPGTHGEIEMLYRAWETREWIGKGWLSLTLSYRHMLYPCFSSVAPGQHKWHHQLTPRLHDNKSNTSSLYSPIPSSLREMRRVEHPQHALLSSTLNSSLPQFRGSLNSLGEGTREAEDYLSSLFKSF